MAVAGRVSLSPIQAAAKVRFFLSSPLLKELPEGYLPGSSPNAQNVQEADERAERVEQVDEKR